jgi:hypothetical protein
MADFFSTLVEGVKESGRSGSSSIACADQPVRTP